MSDRPGLTSAMLPHVHDHIGRELLQVARTDTVFMIVAVLFNLVVLGINWGVGGSIRWNGGSGQHLVFWILVASTVTITLLTVRALAAGAATRTALVAGLARLYADEGVARYYDGAIATNYAVRHRALTTVIVLLGTLAVVVPFIAYVG